jgi:endogenous inhibitor of DNA gyrase (YacG/DUF329 family)
VKAPSAKPIDRQKDVKHPKCPICRKPAFDDYRPFCGKRCADVDLNRWLDGRYVVPGESLGAGPEDADAE